MRLLSCYFVFVVFFFFLFAAEGAQKERSDGWGNFQCQHGAEECKGNMIQSCALKMLSSWGPKEELVNCIMSSQNPIAEACSCAYRLGMPWWPIQGCMVDGTGTDLQLKAEVDTYNVQHGSISFVPTIVFNHRYNKKNQNDGLHNFRAVVCRLLAAQLPKACSNRRSFFGF
ncbi:hypothetical protein C0J52_15133 [Blattella germanica]|nr:hypothetical protein C0J52_15133 [Blattella germanica]